MKQTELDWFRPLWRRVAVTVFVAVWFAWEVLWNQEQLWMAITGLALAYAVWNFFIKFEPRDSKPDKDGDNGKPQA